MTHFSPKASSQNKPGWPQVFRIDQKRFRPSRLKLLPQRKQANPLDPVGNPNRTSCEGGYDPLRDDSQHLLDLEGSRFHEANVEEICADLFWFGGMPSRCSNLIKGLLSYSVQMSGSYSSVEARRNPALECQVIVPTPKDALRDVACHEGLHGCNFIANTQTQNSSMASSCHSFPLIIPVEWTFGDSHLQFLQRNSLPNICNSREHHMSCYNFPIQMHQAIT